MEGKNVINDKAYNHRREQLPQAGMAGVSGWADLRGCHGGPGTVAGLPGGAAPPASGSPAGSPPAPAPAPPPAPVMRGGLFTGIPASPPPSDITTLCRRSGGWGQGEGLLFSGTSYDRATRRGAASGGDPGWLLRRGQRERADTWGHWNCPKPGQHPRLTPAELKSALTSAQMLLNNLQGSSCHEDDLL